MQSRDHPEAGNHSVAVLGDSQELNCEIRACTGTHFETVLCGEEVIFLQVVGLSGTDLLEMRLLI